jgi:hypothetical protein
MYGILLDESLNTFLSLLKRDVRKRLMLFPPYMLLELKDEETMYHDIKETMGKRHEKLSRREYSLGKTVRGLEDHYDAPLDHVVLIGWKFT